MQCVVRCFFRQFQNIDRDLNKTIQSVFSVNSTLDYSGKANASFDNLETALANTVTLEAEVNKVCQKSLHRMMKERIYLTICCLLLKGKLK